MNSDILAQRFQLATVPFRGQTLITIKKDEIEFVAMKPIVEGIGLDWKSQSVKLNQQKEKFNCGVITMIAEDSKTREMLCIPLRKLNGWLFTINPAKVRPEIREKVIQYQEECFEALHDYWHTGRALSPRQQPQLPPSSPAPAPSQPVLPVYIESARPIFHYPLESQFSDQEKLGFTRAGAMTVILQTTSHLLKKEMNSPLRKMLYQIVQENMGDVRGCIEELDCLYFQIRSIHTHVESLRNLSNEMQSKVERLMNEGRTIVVKKG